MDVSLILMSILLLAMFAQWLAWKLKLPAILFLLIAGIIIGPISGLVLNVPGGILDPSRLLGDDLLYPMVSLSVGIVLFEGCMSLKLSEIKGMGGPVRNLVTIGLLMTAVLTTVFSHYILNFPWEIAALLGAITSVSGPTVVVPILRSVRPTKNLANVIKWEGMLIDPIGALLAALVFSTISSISQFQAVTQILIHVFGVAALGVGLGVLSGWILGTVLRRHWVPDYLSNLFALSCVIVSFAIAEYILEGAGLLSVTIMGVFVGNMRNSHIEEVMDFKEHLSLLLISVLFIVLAANVSFSNLEGIIAPAVILILCLQFIVRPLAVFVCTLRSNLNWRERVLLGWIAPRGIVVAAVAALFSVKLINEAGNSNPEYVIYGQLLSLVAFLIIIGTVTIPSLTASFLARFLRVSSPDPKGFLIVGANKFARAIAKALEAQGLSVVLADVSWRNIQAARLEGLQSYYGNSASEHGDWHMEMVGIGRMLGLSSHDQINTLSAVKYYGEFGSNSVFLLPASENRQNIKLSKMNKKYGKRLFTDGYVYEDLRDIVNAGAVVKTTKITSEFNWEQYLEMNDKHAIQLFAVSPKLVVHVVSPDSVVSVSAGWSVIALVSEGSPLSEGRFHKNEE
jgi:NhaP-type Na+/H+ or K+/H+ antiporter